MPAAVSAPYERGENAPQRQVASQRERDLDAIALARRKGVMVGQLGELADDDRLAPESRPVIEWFAAEVKAAPSGSRLDELTALLPEAGIRRRRFWHRTPAIEAGDWDDDLQDDDDSGDAARPAITAAPVVDYGAELAARQWVFRPHGAGLCQLVHLHPHGWDWLEPEECIGRLAAVIPGGAVCESCHYALNRPLAS